MAIAGLVFPSPLQKRPTFVKQDYARRDQAIRLFESNEPLSAAHETLRYLNPGAGKFDLAKAPLRWAQGTAQIQIALEANRLSIKSQLICVNAAKSNPAVLRYFLSKISNTGQLFQPRLSGDVLELAFSEQLNLLHPQKLIEVLQKLPGIADSHDAWLCDELGADLSERAKPKALSAPERKRALSFWTQHWRDMEALLLESRRRRSVQFLDSVGRLAINHVRYVLPLFGSLRHTLNQSADVFTDRDENPKVRENELARSIRTMREASEEQLLSCLGHVHFAFSPWTPGSADVLRSAIGNVHHMHQSNEMRLSGRALEASVGLVANFLYLLAYFAWPAPVERALRAAIAAASDKPWQEAADILWKHAQAIADKLGSSSDEDSDADSSTDEQGEHA